MFHKKIKYTVISLALIGMTGCNQRTILIHPPVRVATPEIIPNTQPTIIQEEILINKNPNLGERVVPSKEDISSNVNSENNGSSHGYKNVDNEMEQDIPEAVSVARNQIMQRIAFPVAEYNRLSKRGRSTVSGQVYLTRSVSSEKFLGKKIKLYLNPVTSYSEQWYQESYLNGYKMSKSDKRLYNYLKFTMSNNSGNYNFFGVPRGNYYLVGVVKCGKECGFSSENTIRLVKRVSVGFGVTSIDLIKNIP